MREKKLNSDAFIDILSGKDKTRFQKFLASDEELIEITNVDLNEGVHLKDFTFETPIVISNGQFENLIFENVVFKKLIINNGQFKKLEFRCCEFTNGFTIYNADCKGKFRLHAPKSPYVRIMGGIFYDETSVSVDNLYLDLYNFEVKRKIDIQGCSNVNINIENIIGKVLINNTYDNVSIRINLANLNPSIVEFTHLNSTERFLEKLEIGDINKNSIVKLSKAYLKEMIFNKSSIQGHLFLSEFRVMEYKNKKIIRIIDSDLGYSSFINCHFEDYFLEFENSKIANIFIAGTFFPSQKYINTFKLSDSENQKNKVQVLSQLKKICESKGDFIQANRYRAAELNTYYKTLNWLTDFPEKTVTFLNKFSSNHSQNWVQAFFTTILFSVITYCIYCYILNPSIFSNYSTRINAFYLFFEFINPLHKAEFISGRLAVLKIPEAAIAWENCSRIIITFFVYQFIQSFRKYGKS